MIISILNCDKNYGIGKKNGLLFKLPKDMEFFRNVTKGHVVCMGKNTLLSFPGSKPLINRVNVVLTNNDTDEFEGTITVHTFDEFLHKIKEYSKKGDVFIIGGASIYQQTLPYVDKVLLTKVDSDGDAEVFFPNLDIDKDFECVDNGTPIMDGDYLIRFTTYINKNKKEII